MNETSVLLRRANKLLLPPQKGTLSAAEAASFNLNLQDLGYTLSATCLKAIRKTTPQAAHRLLETIIPILKELKGVKNYRPMYPNFPAQVMEASEAELYINAIVHYFTVWLSDCTGTDCIWLPKYRKAARQPLDEKIELTVIEVGRESDLETIATALVGSNTSLSGTDKEDLIFFVGKEYLTALPPVVPQKENLAIAAAALLRKGKYVEAHFKVSTDILRLAVALSGGDVSLVEDSKFTNLKRKERKLLLKLLNNCVLNNENAVEDMLRWKQKWLRLGERLHPGEYKDRYSKAFNAFAILRRNTPVATFNSAVEKAIRSGLTLQAAKLLQARPGDFARRLDHLVRINPHKSILAAFEEVVGRVSTPVLLQVLAHFQSPDRGTRIVFPKGQLAKVCLLEQTLPLVPRAQCTKIVSLCTEALIERFSVLPRLGHVYLDPALKDCLVPFSQRSASAGLRTLVRGSKLKFGDEKDTLRFFIWWKEQKDSRADLDLSAAMYNSRWEPVEQITYYNLRGSNGVIACHSGDITSAPNGACEFIDVNLPSVVQNDGRYIIMSVNSFTEQNFSALAECSAGWMLREKPQSGEVFDPRTIVDKIDVTMEAKLGVPLIIDVVERKVIWVDASVKTNRGWVNNVRGNANSLQLLGRSFTELQKPNLYDLLSLHVKARGKFAQTPDQADVVFSIEAGTPFDLAHIASEFMKNATFDQKLVTV